MAKDPVCGMEIDERGFTFHTEYKGKVYHFCRPTCKELFLAEPKRYIASLERKATIERRVNRDAEPVRRKEVINHGKGPGLWDDRR